MATLYKALGEMPRAYYLLERRTGTQENELAIEGIICRAPSVISRAKVQRKERIISSSAAREGVGR